ncbi:putative ER to Golgi transport-related protein [Rozella allomycis CSF55]|uniref:Putative ER to Golgi transport-related protein n=1 Tax=Rozella allomycis (strain CSF55) TaxID=988480 RepID=A0A4V1IZT9_ROZAC|nr:putative ER to Golgi transport-related protein [Rozella allomycis CSF55]
MGEVITFLIALLLVTVLLFAMIFFVIMYSDLECDYMNPIDLCNKLNPYIIPEILAHGTLTIILFIGLYWVPVLWNIPLLAYHIYCIANGRHMLDATEIFRRLPERKREAFVKLGFYLLSFFYYIYR